MSNINVNVIGTVKFFDQSKGFGIIKIMLKGKPADVFIHVTKCDNRQAELVTDAEVCIDFNTAFKDGQFKHSATALLSVKAPPAPIEVLDVVKFFNSERDFGFIFCGGYGFSKDEAILRGHVLRKAGLTGTDKGMAVRAMVIQKREGPEVLTFEWGPDVEAAYAAKLSELHAEDGATVELETADSADDAVEATTETAEASAKPKQRRAPKKQGPADIPAVVAVCALNGSGGAMADAFRRATAH
jgi:cold shock CspA family protein